MKDEQLFSTYIPRLRRYARALTGDRFWADDLVQECLARGWEKRNQWETGSDLRAWLFTILHNLYVTDVRRRTRRPDALNIDDDVEFPASGTAEARVELRDLENALRQLPDEQRMIILLVGIEDMSYVEVSNLLGIPTGTVMSRLSRGRERLRALMTGAPPQLRRVK